MRDVTARERVLFIGTRFSNLYTAVDTSVILWEMCWGSDMENRQARKSRGLPPTTVLIVNIFQMCPVLARHQFHLACRSHLDLSCGVYSLGCKTWCISFINRIELIIWGGAFGHMAEVYP